MKRIIKIKAVDSRREIYRGWIVMSKKTPNGWTFSIKGKWMNTKFNKPYDTEKEAFASAKKFIDKELGDSE